MPGRHRADIFHAFTIRGMEILLYIFCGLFIVFALGMVFAYTRQRHIGLLFMAAAYAGGAGVAIALGQGWPLLAGIGLAWVIKLIGLDPEAKDGK